METLGEAIATFTCMAAEKLRKQHSLTRQMQIFIYTNRHKKEKAQHYEGKLIMFPAPTNSTIEMVNYAMQALKVIFKNEYAYKKAGVILYDILPDTGTHNLLFDTIDRPKHAKLMQTMDIINAQHGKNSVAVGAQGMGKIPSNQGKLSPRYTTRWDEIMVVKV
jgi:DNA polymerase V